MNIIFTSVGRRVELIRAFRRAYDSLNLKGNIVGVDMDPLAPALHFVDRRYLVPPVCDPDYIPSLTEICRKESTSFLFPLIDPDIPVLSRHRKTLQESETELVAVSSEAAEIITNKSLTERFFSDVGLKFPISYSLTAADLSRLPYPVFVKPSCGSAGKNSFVARNRKELEFFIEYIPDPIVQEYLPGAEITSDVICDHLENILAVVSRRRIEVRFGEVSKGITVLDQRIQDACIKIAQRLHARGPITVQCIMKDNQPYFTEINARFGGGLPLGIAAGADSPKWLLARLAGIPIEIPPLGTYQTGLYLSRFDESHFSTEADHVQIPH